MLASCVTAKTFSISFVEQKRFAVINLDVNPYKAFEKVFNGKPCDTQLCMIRTNLEVHYESKIG